MTKIIAFSWNSNTGKSTAIHMLYEQFSHRYPNKKIKIFEETAREYIDAHGWWMIDDVHDFETYIINQETKRLEELKLIKETKSHDLVFIDRTGLDAIIYSYRNLINGNIARIDYVENYHSVLQSWKQLYDFVVFFTTPIKIDRRFPIYNNEHINAIFEHSVRFWYEEKVITYTNNIFFQDNIESTIFWNIFDM
jgi:AAA domain